MESSATFCCDIIFQKKRNKYICITTFTFQKGNWNIFFRNILLKLVLKIFEWRFKYCEARPPRFVAKLAAAVMWHAMFIVTCGETSDPHPRGVNITRPCRALSLTPTSNIPLYMKILLVLMRSPPLAYLWKLDSLIEYSHEGRKGRP